MPYLLSRSWIKRIKAILKKLEKVAFMKDSTKTKFLLSAIAEEMDIDCKIYLSIE